MEIDFQISNYLHLNNAGIDLELVVEFLKNWYPEQLETFEFNMSLSETIVNFSDLKAKDGTFPLDECLKRTYSSVLIANCIISLEQLIDIINCWKQCKRVSIIKWFIEIPKDEGLKCEFEEGNWKIKTLDFKKTTIDESQIDEFFSEFFGAIEDNEDFKYSLRHLTISEEINANIVK